MQSFSVVTVGGHLGADPQIMENEGKPFATLDLAVNRKWKKDDEHHEATDWISVFVPGRMVSLVASYVRKGDPLIVSGKLRTRRWKKGDENRSKTYVLAREITLVKSREKTTTDLLDESSSIDVESEAEKAFSADLSTFDDVI